MFGLDNSTELLAGHKSKLNWEQTLNTDTHTCASAVNKYHKTVPAGSKHSISNHKAVAGGEDNSFFNHKAVQAGSKQ